MQARVSVVRAFMEEHLSLQTRRITFLLTLLAILCALAPSGALCQDPVADITSQIVEIRDKTQSYVGIAKGALHDSDLVQAQKLYSDVFSTGNAWNTYVGTSIRDGKTKIPSLKNDPVYQERSKKVMTAETNFLTFVDSKTTVDKAVMTIISATADLGWKLWTQVADRRKQERNAAADALTTATKWSAWADIK
jgi:hypothetical protein